MPTISVIVPVYKVEPYLHQCVDSILNQTFRDFELILVDDGSPDGCPAICDEYARADSRVRVIHKENGGLSSARNAGLDWMFANSKSQWIAFVDSDDWVHPEYLSQLLTAAEQFGVNVSICGYKETEGSPLEISDERIQASLWTAKDFYEQKHVTATIACGKLYEASCFQAIRYPVGKIHEDEFVTYRILFDQKRLAFVDYPLYAYYVNPEGITKSNWSAKRLDVFEALEEQILFFTARKEQTLQESSIRNYARALLYHHREYIAQKEHTRSVCRIFQEKARWFLRNYRSYFRNDTETTINLFWLAHPLLSKIYHRLKNR